MTSDEIRKIDPMALSIIGWLREIAAQLAALNERPIPQVTPVAQLIQNQRGTRR